jgi:hypothetical protein
VSYLIFKCFYKFFKNYSLSLAIAGLTLYIPYVNLAACFTGPELIQVWIYTFLLKKIVHGEYDWELSVVLLLLCLLRPEGYVFCVFILGRLLYLKYLSKTGFVLLPLMMVLIWMGRNQYFFGTFSLVNPIHSSRAVIGSIYGAIYTEPHPFHIRYNYYEGFNYPQSRSFVEAYNAVVKNEMIRIISEQPLSYMLHRLYWMAKCFSYVSFFTERLPDKYWHFTTSNKFEETQQINSYWSYSNLWLQKDYFRLALRMLYNGGLALLHFLGLFYLLFHYRKLKDLFFIFFCFSYIFIIEADMRYFIFIQMMSICLATVSLYGIYKRI